MFDKNFSKYEITNLGWTRLPPPPITLEDKLRYGSNDKESYSNFLSKLVMLGFEDKLKKNIIPVEKYQEYMDRCKMELNTFDELHFTNYMLLVWKVIEKAKELGVFIDFGRGSVAGSIVAWLLGISGCDPIKYNLFFSRFLNKARAKSKIINKEIWTDISLALDVDLNLGEGREQIIEWLKSIYPNRISKISNVSTLTGKVLIKDVYKTLENASEEQSKEIADLIERRFGVVEDIEKTYENNKEFKDWADNHLVSYNCALQLRNLIRQTASHASGYLLSFEELTEHTPLCLDSNKDITSVYTMDNVQCLKLDLLGLETNKIIKHILENIDEEVTDINLENDPIIYEQLSNGSFLPYGLYQISADCAYRVCCNLKPKNVMELSHVNAIARPVSLPYEKPYKDNLDKCPHPLFENALKWTNYQPLYQEQTLMCLKAIGYDDIEAEQARRVFAKKKIDEVQKQVILVKEKIKENNIPEEAGKVLIKLCEDGASYQFNLSHSLSTSYLTALTVYLKYKYPLQFYVACLNEAKNKPDFIQRLGQIYKELPSFNLKLLPPHILKSDMVFKVEEGNIRFSLGSIKGINNKSIEKLQKFKNKYSSKFEIFKAADTAELNLAVVSNLIWVGSLDDMLTESRAKTQMEFALWNLMTDNEKTWAFKLEKEYHSDLIQIIKVLNEKRKNEKGKPIIKDSRRLTLRKNFKPYVDLYDYNKQNPDIFSFISERDLLGFSYSHNLYDIYKNKVEGLIPINQILGEPSDIKVNFICEVVESKLGTSKEKKTPYLRLNIKDHSAEARVMMFNAGKRMKVDECKEINGRLPEEGDIVIITGTKMEGNMIFADKIGIQKYNVFFRAKQLPKSQESNINS